MHTARSICPSGLVTGIKKPPKLQIFVFYLSASEVSYISPVCFLFSALGCLPEKSGCGTLSPDDTGFNASQCL